MFSEDFANEEKDEELDRDDEIEEEQAEEIALQREADLARAACLRAAIFFNGTLNEEDTSWLAGQEDVGLDLLALRPDWKYGIHG